ncbi:orotidine-5'-phosphate decarboxylase [Desulfococcaceae bacterium HSG9]|nr:orotidine-5'-phosphate decarboxylase [Desulfococcaceae bacterium HSG9]
MRQAKDYIIFPLDLPTYALAKEYIDLLSEHVGVFKVGLELFIHCGPSIVHYIQSSTSAKVFLDLKLHDIPATVGRAMERIAELGPALATVHCGESQEMLQAAVTGSHGKTGVLGVTILTSVSGDHLRNAGFKPELASDLSKLVLKRALMAQKAGCLGVVCSAREVRQIKAQAGPDFVAVTPGIRPTWQTVKQDDQKRIMTPAQAVKNGSDYIVVGRPIRDAANPSEAALRIAEEIAQVL